MAVAQEGFPEDQELEGIVTYCNDRRALVWIEAEKQEREINFAYRSRRFGLGDWLSVSQTADEFRKIEPCLETRVLDIGVVQVKTQVIFNDSEEKIGHGTIIESKHFGRVAVFTPFSGIITGRVYNAFVERIPRNQHWDGERKGVHWFVPSNQIPRIVRAPDRPRNDVQLTGPLTGVVVSKNAKYVYIWTPSLGEGMCELHLSLNIGTWIKFMADSRQDFMHPNISYSVFEWTVVDGVLETIPTYRNLMIEFVSDIPFQLKSFVHIPRWPMDNLLADWVGSITDRQQILELAVLQFGVGKTYHVKLKRRKKSVTEPSSIWDVCELVNDRRAGIICYVNYNNSSVSVHIPDTEHPNGRSLCVPLSRFGKTPALGDWYFFEINDRKHFWEVKNAVKSPKLCNTRLCGDEFEVETDVVLTDKTTPDGSRIAFSTVFGAVEDDTNSLPNDTSSDTRRQKYTVWCTTMKATPNRPRWRITRCSEVLPAVNRNLASRPDQFDFKTERLRESGDDSYVGIIVSETGTSCFVWTPTLGEGIFPYKSDLRIGQWIRFWIIKGKMGMNGNVRFVVDGWKRIDSLFPARRTRNTAVVTLELTITKNQGRQPPKVPFFGEVLDKKAYFGDNIDRIRGNVIEMDVTRVKKSQTEPFTAWDITYVKVKIPTQTEERSSVAGPVEMNTFELENGFPNISLEASANPTVPATTQRAASSSAVDQTLLVNNNLNESGGQNNFGPSFGRRDLENGGGPLIASQNDGENEEHDEGYEDFGGEDNTELDPVICSMQLLFESKEVREAIKENCYEEYRILCKYYNYIP